VQTVGLLVWLTLASVVLSLVSIVGTPAGRALLRTAAHGASRRGFVRWITFTRWTLILGRRWVVRRDMRGRRSHVVVVGLMATGLSLMFVAARWHRLNVWLQGEPS